MIQATQPISHETDTVIPPAVCDRYSVCDRHSGAIEFDAETGGAEQSDRVLAPERRRITHVTIRFGKCFEFVVECCQL